MSEMDNNERRATAPLTKQQFHEMAVRMGDDEPVTAELNPTGDLLVIKVDGQMVLLSRKEAFSLHEKMRGLLGQMPVKI